MSLCVCVYLCVAVNPMSLMNSSRRTDSTEEIKLEWVGLNKQTHLLIDNPFINPFINQGKCCSLVGEANTKLGGRTDMSMTVVEPFKVVSSY